MGRKAGPGRRDPRTRNYKAGKALPICASRASALRHKKKYPEHCQFPKEPEKTKIKVGYKDLGEKEEIDLRKRPG